MTQFRPREEYEAITKAFIPLFNQFEAYHALCGKKSRTPLNTQGVLNFVLNLPPQIPLPCITLSYNMDSLVLVWRGKDKFIHLTLCSEHNTGKYFQFSAPYPNILVEGVLDIIPEYHELERFVDLRDKFLKLILDDVSQNT